MVRKHRRTQRAGDCLTSVQRIALINSKWLDANTLARVLRIEPQDVVGYPNLPNPSRVMGIGPVWDKDMLHEWLAQPVVKAKPYWDEDLS